MTAHPRAFRSLLAAVFAACALAVPCAATAPTITPRTLQCDGSFANGGATSHPSPTVIADEQSITGLKIGQRRLSIIPSQTGSLWRFDGQYEVQVSSCYTGCNGSGFNQCHTYRYYYNSQNGTPRLEIGRCHYNSGFFGGCAPGSLEGAESFNPVQFGNCAGTDSGAGVSVSSTAISQGGPLPGLDTDGLSAQALALNGSNWATAPDDNLWDLPASYTLSAWIDPSAYSGRIISQQSGTGYWGIGVGSVGNGGRLRHFDSRDAGFTPDATIGAGGDLTAGGWHLVHVVRNNGVSRRFYVDGRFVGSVGAASSSTFVTHPINNTLEIGRYFANGLENFTGAIDDVRIVYTALTDDDIMLEYNTTIHKYSTDGVNFSTVAGTYSGGPTNGTTGAVVYQPGAPFAANSSWRFMAQSTNGESTVGSPFSYAIDSSPPVPSGLTGTPTTANDITWTWTTPTRVCLPPGSASVNYHLVDAPSGSNLIPPGAMAHPTFAVGENIPGVPNQLVGRRLRVTDTWGNGLSPSVTVYTLANPPVAASVGVVSITTGSAMISWNTNGNPSYTRWLVSYAQNAGFTVGLTTPTPLSANYTGSTQPIGGLLSGTTYHVRVQSYNGRASDAFGGVASVFVSTSFTTLPNAPGLSGAATSNSAILWTWTSVPGAQYYKLFDVAGSTLYTGGALSFSQGGLSVNTQYVSRIEAISSHGPSARTSASAFTLANDPTAPVVAAANASSVSYSWNANSNPGYTFYELSVTTDATFGVVVATLTVNATVASATSLFPGTTYYARVRSISGGQQYGNFVAIASTRTLTDPAITVNNGPASVYLNPSGTVAQWQFDAGTGNTAVDSALGNSAFLTCVSFGCTSTPTWTSGPSGLGSAVAFSGLNNGMVRAPDTSTYSYIGSITVMAWANPSTLAQPNGAGLVVRGSGTFENYALDVNAGLWRWTPRSGTNVTSTNAIATNAWVHLIGVYDAALATATIYVNGRPASTALAVPVRVAANHDVTIGNRQSASTTYDRGFIGSIDSVRILHRALSPAQALAEYEANFVSTVTAAPPNDAVQIGLPPNAFGAPVSIFVTMDPVNHPVAITPAALNAGLSEPPTGFVLVPNSLVEIVPIVGGIPFTQNLGSSATVSLPYTDSNNDNIIDGSAPAIAATGIKMFTLNTAVNRWEQLVSYHDPGSRRVTGRTQHFSLFGMFAPLTIGTALDQVRVFPVPWTPGSRDRFDGTGVTFDRLPQAGTIRIISLAGEKVREFSFDGSAAGTVVWDGRNDSGRRTASGVYFARIVGNDGTTLIRKLAIER